MEVKEFVKSILLELDAAIEEAEQQTKRYVRFADNNTTRTVEFDIAVTAEKSNAVGGKAKLSAWHVATVGGEGTKASRTSTVSRVTFGVNVSPRRKAEQDKYDEETKPGGVSVGKHNLWKNR